MKPFDLLNAPLDGVNLIEAGAGTGKTFNIEGLYVRLILETQLQVDQILVLTFTNAATEELRDRIRRRLVLAREAFARRESAEPFLASLVKRCPDPASAELRLHERLIDFDRAAIFTIHGFCQRVLHENAFETQNLFDTELITNQAQLLQEVADDFWRRHFYQAPVEFISFTRHRIKGPGYLFRLLEYLKTPDVKILPALEEPALTALQPFRDTLTALRQAWPPSRESVAGALRDPGLNAVVYGSLKPISDNSEITHRDLRVLALVEAMDRLVNPRSVGFPLFEKFDRLAGSKLQQSTKKKHAPPRHEFFDLCDCLLREAERLSTEMETYLLHLKAKLLAVAASELRKRKKSRNIQFFDDLLVILRNALRADDKNLLQEAIRRKYKAALVDEFQDTDSIQYEILFRLFAHQTGLLFMIGDPKQAIYSFRGADIFSYIKASRNAGATFSLTENWRSRPELINAVNAIFCSTELPFVFEEIPFERSRPAARLLDQPEASRMPFVLWYLEAAQDSLQDKPITKEDAVRRIARAVGAEINRLITRTPPVEPGEIAVLVRTNDQAQLIKRILSAGKVPSVLYSTGNLFDSAEAYEMEIILSAIVDPADLSKIKAAMVTDILGKQAQDLISGDIGPGRWEIQTVRFREYHRLWEHHGFMRMFRRFMAGEHVSARLLGMPEGERKLTNVLHLAEILHRQICETDTGMSGLLKWLADRRDRRATRLEEHQLRLESDEKAVKIVTIHKSKGLEYPIVFCPFAWESSLIRDAEFCFHDIDDDRRLTLDLGSESRARHLAMAQNELLSENSRLLYVALTRAKHACYLAWGRINAAETSSLAYLLHGPEEPSPSPPAEDLTQFVGTQFSAKTDAEFLQDLKRLADRAQNSIRIEPLPTSAHAEAGYEPPKEIAAPLFCRHFAGKIDHSWRIASYSALVSSGAPDVDLPDRDVMLKTSAAEVTVSAAEAAIESRADEHSIFAFPKGARAGIFFHDILEHHDFAAKNPADLERIVTAKLQQYGFDQKWQPVVCGNIKNVLSISLRPDAPQLKLSAIPTTERINEMEFYFPLNPVSSQALADVFRLHGRSRVPVDFSGQMEKLNFVPSRGIMKGYIDLVFQHQQRFYLVDWKSNYLGPNRDAYNQFALHQVMQAEYYILQYHLYTLALHYYLRLRKPDYRYEKDLGGIFYIFIRGVDPAQGPEYGIYFDLPDAGLIHSLGKTLIPGYGQYK